MSSLGSRGSRAGFRSSGWRRGSLRKEPPRNEAAPALARAAVAVTAAGVPALQLEDALLLTSERGTNGVQHPPSGKDFLLLEVSVDKGVLRVVVTDGGSDRIRPRSPDADGGWGLTIVMETASRWGSERRTATTRPGSSWTCPRRGLDGDLVRFAAGVPARSGRR